MIRRERDRDVCKTVHQAAPRVPCWGVGGVGVGEGRRISLPSCSWLVVLGGVIIQIASSVEVNTGKVIFANLIMDM